MSQRVTIMMLIAFLTMGGLTACGKRGDPYRPSDVPEKSAT